MRIPCDTIARLAHLLPSLGDDKIDEAFASFRLDNGMVIVTDRRFMAIEQVEAFEGVFYIRADAALIEQCRIEAQYSSVIEFTPVPALKWTTAITTMGWKIADNIGVWPDVPSEFDRWREAVLNPCKEPLAISVGPPLFEAELLGRLAQAAPSGKLVLEKYFDPLNRPAIARDIDSAHWVGFFYPHIRDGRTHPAATIPGWCK